MMHGALGEILFLCHRIPFPPDRGDKIRSFHLLRKLAEIGPVHVGGFADDARDLSFVDALAPYTASREIRLRRRSRVVAGAEGLCRGRPVLLSLFDDRRLRDWVARTLSERPIRAVVAFSVQMAQFVPRLPADVRFMMDFVDCDSAKFSAYGADQRGPMGWINRREGRVLLDYERQTAGRADICTFVSEAEAALFRAASGVGNARALENGVALDRFDPQAEFTVLPPDLRGEGPLIVFTGQMDYRPNVEAVDSFARLTLPRIRAVHPEARFAIVGRSPAAAVRRLDTLPGVAVTGEVPDVRPWLAAADAVVAPLRIGRGVQNKVLEAMAMARPVVASAEAARGIDAEAGRHLLVVASPAEEAAQVMALIADPACGRRIGEAARARMVERYHWDATLRRLPELLLGSDAGARAAA